MQSQHRDIAYMDVGTYDLSGTKIMTVDVQGCTNALKDRMSEKGHPEHSSLLAISVTAPALLYFLHPCSHSTVTLPTWM